MHSKIIQAIEKLRALRARAVQRAMSDPAVRHAVHRVVELSTMVRARVEQSHLTRRHAMFGLAAAAVLIAGIVGATMALSQPTPEPVALTAADPGTRQGAADRADRSSRTMGAFGVPYTPAPATEPTVAATMTATAAPRASAAPKAAPTATATKAASTKTASTKTAGTKATSTTAARTKAAAKKPAWINPMPKAPLSSCFGPRWGTVHQGIDFAGRDGTKILSVGAGTVVAAGWNYTGYGISVVVDHGNGYLSHYAHAQKVLVQPGQKVAPGQPLALEGTTGDSTGPHLHFEIHKGMWNQIEPAGWLRDRGVQVDGC